MPDQSMKPHADLIRQMIEKREREAQPVSVDPVGCDCLGCCLHVAVPLDKATPVQILDMVRGHRANRTGMDWQEIHDYLITRQEGRS